MRQNVGAMIIGQLITWSLTATTIALLPRYLGPERIGQYAIGGSFEMLGLMIAGLGMPLLITKEAARDRNVAATMMGTAIWLSIGFGLVTGVIATLIALATGYQPLTVYVVALKAAAIPATLITALAYGLFQGVEMMRYQAVFDIAIKLLGLAGLIVIIGLDLGLMPIPLFDLAVAAAVSIAIIVYARRVLPFRVFSLSPSMARYVLRESMPFWTVGIFLVLYQATDALLLSRLADETAVGIYSAPTRIFATMMFVPTIITTVTFPRMALLHRDAPHELAEVARLTLKLVLAIGTLVSITAVALADDTLVGIIGDDFSRSGAVIVVLAISLVPTSTSIVANRILTAVDRQRLWTAVMLVAFVAKVALDFVAIPLFDRWYGNPALGAAVVLVAIEFVMMLGALWLMPRGVLDRAMFMFYGKLAIATGTAVAAMFAWSSLGALAAGAAGAICYVSFAALLGLFTPAQVIAALRWGVGRSDGALPEALR